VNTAKFEETYSAGSRHATEWIRDPQGLTSADLMTLAVVGVLADSDLFTDRGYYGVSAFDIATYTGVSQTAAERRLNNLVAAGALVTREGYARSVRYWLPDEVRIA
jgi:hypothetical protein